MRGIDDSTDATTSRKVPWNPAVGVVFVILLFFAAQIVAGLLISIYPALRHWTAAHTNTWLGESVLAQFWYLLLAEGLMLAAIYWFLKRYHSSWSILGLVRPRWRDMGYALLALPVYFISYVLLVAVVSQFFRGLDINQAQDIGFNDVHGGLPLLLTFISLVILPPLSEEIMVRGVLFGSLKKAVKVIPAALLTSAIFALAHLPEGGAAGPLWIAALDTFVLSLILCYLRQRTGSLWASIGLHALKNGIAFVALFIVGVR